MTSPGYKLCLQSLVLLERNLWFKSKHCSLSGLRFHNHAHPSLKKLEWWRQGQIWLWSAMVLIRVKLKNIDKDETAETHGNNEYDHGDNGCSGDGWWESFALQGMVDDVRWYFWCYWVAPTAMYIDLPSPILANYNGLESRVSIFRALFTTVCFFVWLFDCISAFSLMISGILTMENLISPIALRWANNTFWCHPRGCPVKNENTANELRIQIGNQMQKQRHLENRK